MRHEGEFAVGTGEAKAPSGHWQPITVEPIEKAPDGWQWCLLTDVARLESGHTPSRRRPDWWGGDVPWIALPDIRALDGKTAYETVENTNDDGLANSSARLLPAGTVVLSRTASVGFVTVMGRPMATSQDFVNWVCGPDLDSWFLAHALISVRPYLRDLSSGAIHKTIYVPAIKQFRICLPLIERQREIVLTIDDGQKFISRAREAAERRQFAVLAMLDEGREALLNLAEDEADDYRPIGELCEIDGPLVDPRNAEVEHLPCVSGEHIESVTGKLLSVPSAKQQGMRSGKFRFEEGAILYSKLRPYLRKVALAPFRGLCSADMYPLRARPGTDSRFLAMLLLGREFSAYANGESRRARMPKLNQEQLFGWRAPYPPLEAQQEIADRMSDVAAKVSEAAAAAAAQLTALDELPAALLCAAFRGEA